MKYLLFFEDYLNTLTQQVTYLKKSVEATSEDSASSSNIKPGKIPPPPPAPPQKGK